MKRFVIIIVCLTALIGFGIGYTVKTVTLNQLGDLKLKTQECNCNLHRLNLGPQIQTQMNQINKVNSTSTLPVLERLRKLFKK